MDELRDESIGIRFQSSSFITNDQGIKWSIYMVQKIMIELLLSQELSLLSSVFSLGKPLAQQLLKKTNYKTSFQHIMIFLVVICP